MCWLGQLLTWGLPINWHYSIAFKLNKIYSWTRSFKVAMTKKKLRDQKSAVKNYHCRLIELARSVVSYTCLPLVISMTRTQVHVHWDPSIEIQNLGLSVYDQYTSKYQKMNLSKMSRTHVIVILSSAYSLQKALYVYFFSLYIKLCYI